MSSKFNSGEQDQVKDLAARAFQEARDGEAHDRLRASEQARQRIEGIEAEARRARREMHEQHALDWERDVVDEKARLLLEKMQPAPEPDQSFTGGIKSRGPAEEDLTRRAERNVEQNNDRAIRKTFLLEEVLINAVIREDIRSFEAQREAERTEPVSQIFTQMAAPAVGDRDGNTPDHDRPTDDTRDDIDLGDFYRGAGERGDGRER